MSTQDLHRASRHDSLWAAANTEQHVDATVAGGCGNSHRNITLVEAHPGCAGGLDLFDDVFVAWLVDNSNAQVGNRNFFRGGQGKNVFFSRHVDIADANTLGTRH